MNLFEPESVWDYPRPPRAESVSLVLRVVVSGEVVAETRQGIRLLETGHPPTYYFPRQDVRMDALLPSPHRTECPWRGTAHYFHVLVGKKTLENAAWSYFSPKPAFAEIGSYIAFYADGVEAFVEAERVRPEEGGFYGGWITSNLVGLR